MRIWLRVLWILKSNRHSIHVYYPGRDSVHLMFNVSAKKEHMNCRWGAHWTKDEIIINKWLINTNREDKISEHVRSGRSMFKSFGEKEQHYDLWGNNSQKKRGKYWKIHEARHGNSHSCFHCCLELKWFKKKVVHNTGWCDEEETCNASFPKVLQNRHRKYPWHKKSSVSFSFFVLMWAVLLQVVVSAECGIIIWNGYERLLCP